MPSKTSSEKYNRPPSPYSAAMSPRVTTSTRTLNHNNTREMWLKSLRQGTDMRRDPIKAVHGMHKNRSLNMGMANSTEYLRERVAVTNQQHRNSNGPVNSGPKTYKSQEEMYDEIIQLKKKIVEDKEKFDLSKSRLRRLEEENSRKDKEIEKFLDPTKNEQVIRSLAGGQSKSSSVLMCLKQRNLRLEQNLKEKEIEFLNLKTSQKTTDYKEMKMAMEMYYQEVLRLEGIMRNESNNTENSFGKTQRGTKPRKNLRENVLRLTSENTELQGEIKSLKRDLNRALDGGSSSGEESDVADDKIKYSALTQAELVSMVKKMKQMRTTQAEILQLEEDEEKERMRGIILQVKEDRNQLRNENNNKTLEIEKLGSEYEKVVEENQALRHQLNKRERDYEEHNTNMQKKRSRDERNEQELKVSDFQKSRAAKSIQRNWREYKTKKHQLDDHEDTLELLQSSFKGHLYRQQKVTRTASPKRSRYTSQGSYYREIIDETTSEHESATNDEVTTLQAAMRGHLARQHHIQPTSPNRSRSSYVGSSHSPHHGNNDQLSSSDEDDVVVFGNF